uniref:DDE Tnp4 domain-containing protein n=1 Tax=Arundo donax TaxID=35708 RepID=A0A0A8ZIA9_ARUDO
MKWRILLKMHSYDVDKQSQIITATMALHNFIRDSAIDDAHFDNISGDDDSTEDSQDTADDKNASIDESDMGAFRDSIAAALLS